MGSQVVPLSAIGTTGKERESTPIGFPSYSTRITTSQSWRLLNWTSLAFSSGETVASFMRVARNVRELAPTRYAAAQ
jgi:hypothetical protein